MPKKTVVKKTSTKKVVTRTKSSTVKQPQSTTAYWMGAAVLLVLLFGAALAKKHNSVPSMPSESPTPMVNSKIKPFDFDSKSFELNKQTMTFSNGSYTNPDTTYGQETASITNRTVSPSGLKAAAILVDNAGGSGTFYYLVGATMEDGKETYSQPVLLGDRIKIESITVDDGQAEDNGMISVMTLERPTSAPMAAEPTKKMTHMFAFQENGNLMPVLH